MFHPGSSTGQVAPPQAAAVPLVSPKNVPGAYSVLVVSLCPVAVEEAGILLINRKFHTGMQEFARRLPGRIACLVPEIRLGPGVFTMDSVRERAADLPYTVHVAPDDRAAAAPLIADLVGRSAVAQVSEAEWLNLDTAR